MKFSEIDNNWLIQNGSDESERADFPFDALIYREKDFSRVGNAPCGFYRSETLTVERKVDFPKAEKLFLQIEGARSIADVYIGSSCFATVTNPCKYLLDVSAFKGQTHTVKMTFVAPENSSVYTGLGVSGGIKLLSASDPLYIAPDGVSVICDESGERTVLAVSVDVVNDSGSARRFALSCGIFNARSRRVGRRARKFRIRAHSSKTFIVPVKLSRKYEWSLSDAYLYSALVALTENDKELDTALAPVGIRSAALDESKGFMLGGKRVRLRGGLLSHDNGIIGACSVPEAERRKAETVKSAGFNCVRYIGVPTEAALDALDRAGLMCIVDIFSVLVQPKSVGDKHEFFLDDFERVIESSVKTLRKHPCVIAYGICDCPPESYGRGEGASLARDIADAIKSYDDTRFIIASAKELEPAPYELLALGIMPDKVKAAVNSGSTMSLAREKNAFRDLTADWFGAADVAGYSNLYQRYQSDKPHAVRPIIGLDTNPKRIFDSLDETDRNGILGDFTALATDTLGGGRAESDGFNSERCTTQSDIDITLTRKSRSYYREICMGARKTSKIVVLDPEREDDEDAVTDSWNWTRFLGRPVTVKVYTGGDVVALYLDGKLVGRRLAGRINKYTATFTVNYYPGKLEAVSFRKGAEYSRCSLESTSSPKAVKLSCDNKNLSLSGGNMAFVEVSVTDKEGRTVQRAQRDVEVTVSGDGRLYALSSADPGLTLPANVTSIPVYKGRALIAVKGVREGKMTVKVTAEGLLCGKITLKVKP